MVTKDVCAYYVDMVLGQTMVGLSDYGMNRCYRHVVCIYTLHRYTWCMKVPYGPLVH